MSTSPDSDPATSATCAQTPTTAPPSRPDPIRRLYDWVLHWAETPYGLVALAVLAFAESSFFPIPPDILLIALVLGSRTKWWRMALVCSLASIAGGLAGYAIGALLWTGVCDYFYAYIPGFTLERFNHMSNLYETHSFWIVFTAGFTPIPYKIITVSAGVCNIDLPMFVLASAVSRSARFFLVAGLLYWFGEPIRNFIDRWFGLLTIAFVVLLLGGFAVIKYVL